MALALVCLSLPSLLPAAYHVQESLAKWNRGKRVQVVLNNGTKLIGRLGAVQPDSFVLEPDKKTGSARTLRFDEVRSVKSKWTTGEKWVLAGLIYAGITLLSALTLGN